MIIKKFLYFKSLATFQEKLTANEIISTHIAFIQDINAIWTHDKFFYANTQSATDLAQSIANTYVKKETNKGLSTNDFTDELKALVEKLQTPMNYKGSVATYDTLPKSNVQTGDVYNVTADGKNYAWDGSAWDLFGLSAIDIVNDLTTGGVSVALSAEQGKVLKTAIDQEINDRTQNVATEVSRAKAAEDKIEASVGLSEDGSYKATTGDYTKNATSVMGAIVALETQVKASATAIDALAGDGTGSVAEQIADAKTTIDNYTVNSKKISTNPVLGGSDIKLTGYTAVSNGAVTAADTVNSAINKIDSALTWYEGE